MIQTHIWAYKSRTAVGAGVGVVVGADMGAGEGGVDSSVGASGVGALVGCTTGSKVATGSVQLNGSTVTPASSSLSFAKSVLNWGSVT